MTARKSRDMSVTLTAVLAVSAVLLMSPLVVSADVDLEKQVKNLKKKVKSLQDDVSYLTEQVKKISSHGSNNAEYSVIGGDNNSNEDGGSANPSVGDAVYYRCDIQLGDVKTFYNETLSEYVVTAVSLPDGADLDCAVVMSTTHSVYVYNSGLSPDPRGGVHEHAQIMWSSNQYSNDGDMIEYVQVRNADGVTVTLTEPHRWNLHDHALAIETPGVYEWSLIDMPSIKGKITVVRGF